MPVPKIEGIQPVGEIQGYRQWDNLFDTLGKIHPVQESEAVRDKPNNLSYIKELSFKTLNREEQKGRISRELIRIKEAMISIRRTLPPFPPGSQERVRILKGYIGLRRLIEQLTLPRNWGEDPILKRIDLPELGEEATDQEIDHAISGLEKAIASLK